MRIGVDMLGHQSPHSRGRGIGRYARSLVTALLADDSQREFVLYAHDGLPTDLFPAAPHAVIRPMPAGHDRAQAVQRLARDNPDDLDALVILSPFEHGVGYAPPVKPVSDLVIAAVVYDLVPFLFQERYLTYPPVSARFYRNLERLAQYDALLAISEATRADCQKLLGLPPDRVVNIRGACDRDFFRPATTPELADADRRELGRLGITGPFVFCVASSDWRKNLWGLIEAYRILPEPLHAHTQLVVSCHFQSEDRERVREFAAERGLADRLVLTGEIDDDTLRLLYQRCAAFAAPSFYEGFGLPLLEAMSCGATVIGGRNSSQPEVVGDAGLLANPHDEHDIAAKLTAVLTDADLNASMRSRSLLQARSFTWADTASRALGAIKQKVDARSRSRSRARRPRPKIALFSPLPPIRSGIADYAWRLAQELRRDYGVDLFHDQGYEPDLGRRAFDFGCFDHRMFPLRDEAIGYRAVLYQMGNSFYHRFVYDALQARPGIVTLHELGLASFHHWYAFHAGKSREHFLRLVTAAAPDRAELVWRSLEPYLHNGGDVQAACTRQGFYFNAPIIERATRVIVHSQWCREQIQIQNAEDAAKTSVIPMGATCRRVSPATRDLARARFGLPAEALVCGSLGILHTSKMNVETVAAFAQVARQIPQALLVFVGIERDRGETRRAVAQHGLNDRVRFFGHQPEPDFADLIAATDIGICLRRPPTNGETSAALLDLLRHGVPTVVNDAGTSADYPDSVVCKFQWPDEGVAGLTRALLELAENRGRFSHAAVDFIARNHDWSHTASLYAALIEADASDRKSSRTHRLVTV